MGEILNRSLKFVSHDNVLCSRMVELFPILKRAYIGNEYDRIGELTIYNRHDVFLKCLLNVIHGL